MKKAALIIWILAMLVPLLAFMSETASLENFLFGTEDNCDYDNWVSHIAEGIATPNYNIYAPFDRQTNGFGDYRTPSSSELNQWGNIVDLFLAGMLDEAQTAVNQANFPYQVVEFNDTDTDRTYYMLREIPNWNYHDDNGTPDPYDDEHGAFDYGWGLYIYNPNSSRPIIVSAPHPTDDFPTTYVSYQALTLWDASYLMVSGVGREVRWTNVGSYTNSKSLCDPTRAANHPFNVAYKKFADKIRLDFNCREFSAQIHSYDWNRHVGYTDTQLSAGNGRDCPNLPIRDLSSMKNDLVNKGDHLMIPANTIGTHEDVFLNQYYAVNYSIHDFTFSDGEMEYPVNDHIDLPGYSYSQQMIYTLSGTNDYDVYDPWFHIEMDELPNAYDETENNYKWFYGWDEDEGKWDFDNLYTNFWEYYSRWVIDMESLFDDIFTMDDGLVPPVPNNLHVINTSMFYVTLGWDKSDAYDFDSYEILYATEPITEDNYEIFDRDNDPKLASQAIESINVTGLNNNFSYYFSVRARDKNGNFSSLSNEVTTSPAPANVSSFTAHGMNSTVRLYWTVNSQSGLEGFRIYRKAQDANWIMIDNYLDNPLLAGGSSSYEYWDSELPNDVHYSYRLSMIDDDDYEFIHNVPQDACAKLVHDLHISNADGSLTDSVSFAQNPYATDGRDAYWDTTKGSPSGNYTWLAFWQPYWGQNGTHLSREVKAGYDLSTDLKSWSVRVRSNQYNIPLFLSVPTAGDRSEKLYVHDTANGNWHDLQSGPYEFTVNNSSYRTMNLYWGNLQPSVNYGFMDNQIFQGGNTINFSWSNVNPFLIDHINLYIKNATDSLAVCLNTPPSTSYYSYIIPQVTNMPEAKAYLEVVSSDGLRKVYPSAYTFSIVPRMNLLYNEPGWQTRSNPYPQDSFSIPAIFGDGAQGYIYDQDWTALNEFAFGPGYFVKATDYVFESTTTDVISNAIDVEIQPGWNFIANPHLCHYEISSLHFMVNSTLFEFSELINHKMISSAIYAYRDGAYQMVTRIEPYESFFIKSYASPENTVSMRFYPFYAAPQIKPPAPLWTITLKAKNAETDMDWITIGCSPIASNDYDFRVDLPATPSKPVSPATTLSLLAQDAETYLDEYLKQDFRKDFTNMQTSKEFDFVLDTEGTGMMEFESLFTAVPDDWTVRFYLEGFAHTLVNEGEFSVDLPEAGSYSGRIVIYNHPVNNEDLVQSPLSKINVYPNPFNPTVTIAFDTPVAMDCNVDIYNIRGQKVNTIHKGILSSGNHKLLWNGTDTHGRTVASGVYFARIKTPNSSKSIKMLLMK
ncbi:MAG: T9SS type A sorting domain-containing protein [Candidatus Cloacimonetes bacterium]|nr:T9SS type A sorting domain-containing protein [Candidatus Cloacimonadota bacterium]